MKPVEKKVLKNILFRLDRDIPTKFAFKNLCTSKTFYKDIKKDKELKQIYLKLKESKRKQSKATEKERAKVAFKKYYDKRKKELEELKEFREYKKMTEGKEE